MSQPVDKQDSSIIKQVLQVGVYFFAGIGLITVCIYLAILLGFTKTTGIVDTTNRSLITNGIHPTPAWANTPEWQTLSGATQADASTINTAAATVDIEPRLIVGSLVAEQMRLFFSNREVYKEVFAPFRILGVQSQYSWGVMGMKRDSAVEIEKHLKDPTSPFYLGKQYETLLDFKTADHESERFARLTDQKNHYYSYLYSAIYMKQVITQWQKAGYNISDKAGILGTLFNIGYTHSKPKSNPQIGGAEIEIAGIKYSFGGIVQDFYDSPLLLSEFPRN